MYVLYIYVIDSSVLSFMCNNYFSLQGKNHLPALFAHLTGRQVAAACSLSQKSGDTRLALVLSQCMGSPYPKQLLDMQLNEWAELGVSNGIVSTCYTGFI